MHFWPWKQQFDKKPNRKSKLKVFSLLIWLFKKSFPQYSGCFVAAADDSLTCRWRLKFEPRALDLLTVLIARREVDQTWRKPSFLFLRPSLQISWRPAEVALPSASSPSSSSPLPLSLHSPHPPSDTATSLQHRKGRKKSDPAFPVC